MIRIAVEMVHYQAIQKEGQSPESTVYYPIKTPSYRSSVHYLRDPSRPSSGLREDHYFDGVTSSISIEQGFVAKDRIGARKSLHLHVLRSLST